jgi:hypothetical protein
MCIENLFRLLKLIAGFQEFLDELKSIKIQEIRELQKFRLIRTRDIFVAIIYKPQFVVPHKICWNR